MNTKQLDPQLSASISAKLVSLGVLACSIGWIFHSLSLGLVLRSLSDRPLDLAQFPLWMAACTFSTVGGFVILLAPGGIGVREGLLIETLKDHPQIGPTVAMVAAALLRVVWFATELMLAGFLYLRRKRTEVRSE